MLASAALVWGTYAYAFELFHFYDWGQPFVKLACFEALAALLVIVHFGARRQSTPVPRWLLATELLVSCAWIVSVLWREGHVFQQRLAAGMNDIGGMTEDSVRMLIESRRNPYESHVSKLGEDPAFWGYKYGPGMLLGYAASGYYPSGVGMKLSNAVYIAVSALLLGKCMVNEIPRVRGRLARAAGATVACALFLTPERLFYEGLNMGVNDIFPVMLLLWSIASFQSKHWVLAGFAASLSFAAKFSPAMFFIVLLFRRDMNRRLLLGFVLGLLVCVPFMLWDYAALIRNFIVFHGTHKEIDDTSLFHVTPKPLHAWFTVLPLVSMGVAVVRGARGPAAAPRLAVLFMLLLIATEVAYPQIHGNHLLWFIPFLSIAFALHRHGLAGYVTAGPHRIEAAD